MRNLKKRKITIVAILCLFLPLIALIAIFNGVFSEELTVGQVNSVRINISGTDKKYEDDEDISFFVKVIEDSVKINVSAHPLEYYKKAVLTFEKISLNLEYTLYLSSSPSDCIFIDAEGNLYRISTECAAELISRPDMEFVYQKSSFPDVKFIIGEKSIPFAKAKGSWAFKNAVGSFVKKDVNIDNTPENLPVLLSEDKFSLEFDTKPDWVGIKVCRDRDIVFEGTSENFSNFTYDSDAKLNFTITAEWYENSGNDYYGEIIYEFLIDYDAAVTCILNANEGTTGSCIYLRIDNSGNENIDITTNLSTSKKIEIYNYMGTKIAMLPVGLDNKDGSYTITVRAGAKTFELPYTVKEKVYDTATIKSAQSNDEFISNYNAFVELLSSISAKRERLWTGSFIMPLTGDDTWPSVRYGSYLMKNSAQLPFRYDAVDLVQTSGSQVYAAGDGIAVFAGETNYSGKTLVIDHGMGVMTIYGFLDNLTVAQNDMVYKNQAIGKLGNDESTGIGTLHFGFSIGGVFVNPYLFAGYDIEFFDLIYQK